MSDPRAEWRLDSIERSLQQKADHYAVSQVNDNVDRLQHSLREAISTITQLRFELETLQEEFFRFKQGIEQ